MNTVETLFKLLDLAARYAFIVFATVFVLLIVPDDLAARIKWTQFRDPYEGHLWLVLVFSGMLALQGIAARYFAIGVVAFKKIFFPVRDWKTGKKQSRMIYFLARFPAAADGFVCYQEFRSDGSGCTGYFDMAGKRTLPDESLGYDRPDDGQFHFPSWGRMDWKDVFNGDTKSGCLGIFNP